MNGALKLDMRSYRLVQRALAELPRRVALRVFRIALNAWGGVVKAKAVQLAREETGLLRKSLRVEVTIPDASYSIKHHGKPASVSVGPSTKVVGITQQTGGEARTVTLARLRKTGFRGSLIKRRRPSRYAHLVEKGTKPHSIAIKRGPFAGHTVHHPGTAAHPFIGPAQELGKTNGMTKLREKLEEGILQEAAKLAKT